jgi:hypothetical protein
MSKVLEARDYTRMLRRMIRAGEKYWRDSDCADLRDLVDMRRQLDEAIARAVTGMRESGHTWREIGACAGVSHVAAMQRWSDAP